MFGGRRFDHSPSHILSVSLSRRDLITCLLQRGSLCNGERYAVILYQVLALSVQIHLSAILFHDVSSLIMALSFRTKSSKAQPTASRSGQVETYCP